MRIFLGPVLSAPSFSQRPFLFCAQPHGSPRKDMKFEHHIRCVIGPLESLALSEQQDPGGGFVVPHACIGVFF